MNYRRRGTVAKLLILIYGCLSIIGFIACKQSVPDIEKIQVHKSFSVNFLDVGQGDCIYIRLPDGKNMLIDCGENDFYQENSNYIIDYLKAYEVKTIDYFVLTHPDSDHIGNAIMLINTFSIEKMFIPKIHESLMQNFQPFKEILEIINQKQIEYQPSIFPTLIKGSDYYFAFLSPQNDNRCSYDKLMQNSIPTSGEINNLSPIIYFSCYDRRFIFTGDAESQEEKYVIDNFESDIYNQYYDDIEINLTNVDYLKLSHHGAEDASSEEFLRILKPKNVIISVGGDNYYGHPSSQTLIRIDSICEQYNLYRTDQLGTICIYKDNHEFLVQTSKNN